MATKKRTSKKGNATGEVAAAALAAAAVGAAAGYYFYGTAHAKKHRHAASAWAKGMKKDVEKEVRKLKKVDANSIARVVDRAAVAYQGARGIASGDVHAAAHELKRNWPKLKQELAPSSGVKRAVKRATKAVKGTAKKAKKVAKKSAKRTATKKKKSAKKRAR